MDWYGRTYRHCTAPTLNNQDAFGTLRYVLARKDKLFLTMRAQILKQHANVVAEWLNLDWKYNQWPRVVAGFGPGPTTSVVARPGKPCELLQLEAQ